MTGPASAGSAPPPRTNDEDTVAGDDADVLRGTVRGAGWLGLGAGIVKAAQTGVLLLLAALLEPSALGVITIGALVLNVTSSITDLGTSTALVHWRGDVQRAARTALTLGLGLGLGLTAVVWVAAPWLSAALGAGDLGTDVVRGLMLGLPFIAAAGVSQELLRRGFEFRRRVLPDIVSALVGAGTSVALALAGAGVHALVAGQLLQAVLGLVLIWVVLPPVRPGWSRSDAGGLLSYGGHLAGANIVQLLVLNLDFVLVARILGVTALGVYSMAFRIAYMPVVLVTAVVLGAAFAYLCRLQGEALGRATGDLVVALLALTVPLYLGVLLLAPQLELLGGTWAPGVPALRWLAVYGLLASLLQLAVIVVSAAGQTRDALVINLAHLALLAAALLALTPFGVQAVAIGQVVAVGLCGLFAVGLCRRRVSGLGGAKVARRLVPLLAGAAAMTLTAVAVAAALPWTVVSPLGLVLTGTAIVLAYLAAVVPASARLGVPVLPRAGGSR